MSDPQPTAITPHTAPESRDSRDAETRVTIAAALFAAIRFLTRLPVPQTTTSAEQAARELRAGVVAFPVVGTMIGLHSVGVLVLAGYLWPPPVAVLLMLAVEALLTGAFHEDAVADYCDAFGGGWTRDDILRIMKDSRQGTYGVLGLTLAVALRAALLMSLSGPLLYAALVASATWGRLVILFVMWQVPPLTDRASLAKDVASRVTGREVCLAAWLAGPGLVVWVLLDPVATLAALLVTVAFLIWYRSHLLRTIDGTTGDCLGMSCYAGQLIVLLMSATGR